MLLVRGRIVQAEQRVERLKRLLGRLAAHLLRLVHDHDGTVGSDHVYWAAASERVAPGEDDPRRVVALTPLHVLVLVEGRVERLRVDDHDLNVGTLAEGIDVGEALGVVDEDARLLAVLLHEMVRHGVKALAHTLADSDGRHHDDELAPAVALVQLEHRLDVDVGLARARLHLHVKRARAKIGLCQSVGHVNVVPHLNPPDVREDLRFAYLHPGVGEAHGQLLVGLRPVREVAVDLHVPAVGEPVVVRLSREHVRHALHGIRLEGLYGKFKSHPSALLPCPRAADRTAPFASRSPRAVPPPSAGTACTSTRRADRSRS